MLVRIIILMCTVIIAAGCSATQPPSTVNNLQIKVAQLERKLDERDHEIENLRYELRNLNVQVDSVDRRMPVEEPPAIRYQEQAMDSGSADVTSSDEDIIRVSASPHDVQQALKNAGFYNGAIDGKIGKGSKKAIIDFQRANNLTVDGIIGRKTWSELSSYLN